MDRTKRCEAGFKLLLEVGTSPELIAELEVAAEVSARERHSSVVGFRNLLLASEARYARLHGTDRPNGEGADVPPGSQARSEAESGSVA